MNNNSIMNAPAEKLTSSQWVTAYQLQIAQLPCEGCGASGDQRCKGSCRSALSDEDAGAYPC